MDDERYRDPEGFATDVLEAYPYGATGLLCLTVQSNEDRDLHRSQIMLSEDFPGASPTPAYDVKTWVYSLAKQSDERLFIARSGGQLWSGPPSSPALVIETAHSFTKLCAARGGVYVIGLNGFVGFFDGAGLREIPIPGARDVYFVSEAPDGSVLACGDRGGLYRLEGDAWTRIELPLSVDIYRMVALDARSAVFCGAKGLCARLADGELTTFETPDERKYFCVTHFQDRWYFGSGFRGLEMLEGTAVVPFKEKVYSYELFSDEHRLIASGLNRVARFDGALWAAVDFR